jgi:hypothetical protein
MLGRPRRAAFRPYARSPTYPYKGLLSGFLYVRKIETYESTQARSMVCQGFYRHITVRFLFQSWNVLCDGIFKTDEIFAKF